MQTIRTNLINYAPTQYTNFNYTSMCVFNGVVLGAGSSGLYRACCGDTDNAVAIDAYFVPHKTDFGIANEKTIEQL